MRWLFVPACLSLTALSAAPVGNDFGVPFEGLNHAHVTVAKTPEAEREALPVILPIVDIAREKPTTDGRATSDTPIAIPPQNEAAALRSDIAPLESAPTTKMFDDRAPTDAAPDESMQVAAAPKPKRKPEPKPVIHRSTEEVCDTVAEAAQSNGLPVAFLIHLLFQESRFKPGVVSHAGAQGIAQFMPGTAVEWGVDNPFDPLQAIPASARMLRNLFERFGNLGLAAAAYNAGPRRIQNWLAKKGSLPQETKGYVKTITGVPAERWTGKESGTPAHKLPRHAPCQEEAGLLAWDGPDQIPTPAVAPHRQTNEAVVIAAATPKADEAADKKSAGAESKPNADAKAGVKIARSGQRATATIQVADATGRLPQASSAGAKPQSAPRKKNEPRKIAAKDTGSTAKAGKGKAGKGALQLAARKHRKVRVSAR